MVFLQPGVRMDLSYGQSYNGQQIVGNTGLLQVAGALPTPNGSRSIPLGKFLFPVVPQLLLNQATIAATYHRFRGTADFNTLHQFATWAGYGVLSTSVNTLTIGGLQPTVNISMFDPAVQLVVRDRQRLTTSRFEAKELGGPVPKVTFAIPGISPAP